MQLTVVNNYATQVRTDDPLIYQEVKTIEQSGDIKTAYRFRYKGWINWYFAPTTAKVLWDGTQGTRGTVFQLTQPYTNFYKLRIFWGPYNTGMTSEEIRTFNDNISLHAINAPNTAGSSPALSVEEVNLVGSADKKTLTSHTALYYIQNGVTYSDADSGKSVIYSIIGYNTY